MRKFHSVYLDKLEERSDNGKKNKPTRPERKNAYWKQKGLHTQG